LAFLNRRGTIPYPCHRHRDRDLRNGWHGQRRQPCPCFVSGQTRERRTPVRQRKRQTTLQQTFM